MTVGTVLQEHTVVNVVYRTVLQERTDVMHSLVENAKSKVLVIHDVITEHVLCDVTTVNTARRDVTDLVALAQILGLHDDGLLTADADDVEDIAPVVGVDRLRLHAFDVQVQQQRTCHLPAKVSRSVMTQLHTTRRVDPPAQG